MGVSDFRSKATDDAEAYAMQDAANRVADALREADPPRDRGCHARRKQPFRFSPELWRPDHRGIGFDIGIAAEDIMEAAGLRVYCDNDPFRIDCMRAVLRRLKAMTSPPADPPTIQERLEAVQRLQQLVDELRVSLANTKPIDYAKARDIAQAQIERQQEEVE